MLTLRYRLRPEDESLTLRAVLRERLGLSCAQTGGLKGKAELDGRTVYLNQRGVAGSLLTLTLPSETTAVRPAWGPVRVLYEDDALLALHKPAGIETHPHRGGVSLLNIALGYVRKREPSVCLHPVHRLDVGTEGILLFAKHGCAQALLMKEMEEGSFRKEYVGVVRGSFIPPTGSIRLPIAHDPARGAARFVSSIEGKDAWTDYETVRSGVIDGVDASLVRFLLHTGRTHQIRVHAAALGHPLLGDPLYGGGGKEGMYRLCATRLAFPHPFTGRPVQVETAPSWDLSEV